MKILVIDIETAPHTAYVWGLFKQDIPLNHILAEGRTLCWTAKWIGEERCEFASEFHTGSKKMIEVVHELLDEADVVVHYYGEKFDIPMLNREFMKYGLPPPSPFKQIDLLKVVKKNFKLPSYKLEYVLKAFNLRRKGKGVGMDTWKKCMEGDPAAWEKMLEYNVNDVKCTEELYYFIRPWIANHPAFGLYNDMEYVCPVCGSGDLQARGYAYTGLGKYQRYRCNHCGKWSRDKHNIGAKEIIR